MYKNRVVEKSKNMRSMRQILGILGKILLLRLRQGSCIVELNKPEKSWVVGRILFYIIHVYCYYGCEGWEEDFHFK